MDRRTCIKWMVLCFCLSLDVCSAERNIKVPVKSRCHKKITGSNGKVKSHDGYATMSPYSPGYKCRMVIEVPHGRHAQVTIGGHRMGLRPWDFAIIVDGTVAEKLNFICDVDKYKRLGTNGVDFVPVLQKYIAAGQNLTVKSDSNVVVVDFCVHTFDKELNNRLGFEMIYTSVKGASSTTSSPTHSFTTHRSKSSSARVPMSSTSSSFVSSTGSPSSTTGQAVPGRSEELPPGTCGAPQNPPSQNPNRIVHGVKARENSWPWICTLVQNPTLQFCGCTIIADQWVVTAGHCVDGTSDDQLKSSVTVYLGMENLANATENNKFRIIRVFRHDEYNIPVGSTANDIALIRLDRPIPFSNDAMPACLAEKTVFEKPYVQTSGNGRRVCYVAGWGRLYDGQAPSEGGKIGSGSDFLQQVAIEVMPNDVCKDYMRGYVILDNAFCGGHDNGWYDSCQGDSGGPMMCDDGTGRWTLYGIVSWGLGCAQAKSPGVYTNVAMMRRWIADKMAMMP